MSSIIGVGERLHKVLGQIDLGTLDSGEQSLPFGLLVCFSSLGAVSDQRLHCLLFCLHVLDLLLYGKPPCSNFRVITAIFSDS